MKTIELDVFDRNGEFLGKKRFHTKKIDRKINDWYSTYYNKNQNTIGIMNTRGNDFQNQNYIRITSTDNHNHTTIITSNNLIPTAIYFSVRHCIPATWLNDRDQFLYPNDKWQKDTEFQNDCLAFTLFHGQNRITSQEGVNHFIPFSESQVKAKEAFESHFMQVFIQGKVKQDSKKAESKLFDDEDLNLMTFIPTKPLEFSQESQAVFKAGLALWKYYHTQEFKDTPYNPNTSLYDIKAHFQGFDAKGKMNPPQKVQDSYYKDLIGTLNAALKDLAKKIEPKVYEYEFLLE